MTFISFVMSAKEVKRRAGLFVIGGIVLVIAVAFMRIGGSDRAVAKAFASLAHASSYHTTAVLDLTLPVKLNDDRERPIIGVTAQVEGDVAYEDSTPTLAGTLNVEARGRGMVLFTDGDLRIFRDTMAFRLNELPTLLNPKGNLAEKWTYVDTPLLETKNGNDLRSSLEQIFIGMHRVDRSEHLTIAGKDYTTAHYRRDITDEQKDVLIEILRQGVSGNRALHVLVRLMRAFHINSFDVWVDKSKNEVRQLELSFVDGDRAQRATVTLTFSDYGKEVTIDQPEKELSVRPEVFGNIFGKGELEIAQ